jgi:Ferritin-like domain
MDGRPTRRQLVAGAVTAATGAVALASAPALADTAAPSDSQVLTKVLEVERLMVLAYRQVLASGALAPGEHQALAPFLAHELEHVSTVARQLHLLGAPADTAPLHAKAGDALLGKHHVPGSVTDVHTRKDCFRLLIDLESVAEGAYFTSLKTLGTADLVRMSARAMACEAQHWTILSGLRNPGIYVKSVPWPFVTGSS